MTGCNQDKHPEYTNLSSDTYYKLLKVGETEEKPNYTDYVTVDLAYRTMEDSLFFLARRKFQISEPAFEGAIDECFKMMSVGDSVSFILNAGKFFNETLGIRIPHFLEQGGDFKVDVSMLNFQSEADFISEKEQFLSWINDFSEYERVFLEQYLDKRVLNVAPSGSGLYYKILNEGHGEKVKRGDTISVHYEGRFLNGDFFDSTKKRNLPFDFVFGQEWQVVKGLEEAIGQMKEGEHSLFVLPSHLAFGNSGSSTGIIPPFTSVIFEVELLNIRAANIGL